MLTEFRIPLPLSVEEFERAQLFSIWKTNEEVTKKTPGEGGQVLQTNSFVDETYGEGVFTLTLYRLGDRVPNWIEKVVPRAALVLEERTYMSFPKIFTVMSCPYFKKFRIEITTLVLPGDGSEENVFNLSAEDLKQRTVQMVDVTDSVSPKDYNADLDPTKFTSKCSKRGPLTPQWWKNAPASQPMMCAYKLCRPIVQYWGLQTQAEKLCCKGLRDVFLLTHRHAFCWSDLWWDMSLEDIQQLGAPPPEEKEVPPVATEQYPEDDEDDEDVCFYDAYEEWGSSTLSDYGTPPSTAMMRRASLTNVCGVCSYRKDDEGRAIVVQKADCFCQNCNEFYCDDHFMEFHVTRNQKAHTANAVGQTALLEASAHPTDPGMDVTAQRKPPSEDVRSRRRLSKNGSFRSGSTREALNLTPSLCILDNCQFSDAVVLSGQLIRTLVKFCMPNLVMATDARGERYGVLTTLPTFVGSPEAAAFHELSSHLEHVQIAGQPHEHRLAFFLNLYNAVILHGLLVFGSLPQSPLRRLAFYQKASASVESHTLTAVELEHAILRAHSSLPAVFGASLLPITKFKEHDNRRAFALTEVEPFVSFALCSGCMSAPALRVFTADGVKEELHAAACATLEDSVEVSQKRVVLPKMLDWFARDFGASKRENLNAIASLLPPDSQTRLLSLLATHRVSKILEYRQWDWTFFYRFHQSTFS